MKKLLIPILFVLFLTFGCVGQNKETAKAVTNNTVGILSYTYSINGKNTNTMNLMRNQEKTIDVHVKNIGRYKMNDFRLKLISCLEPKRSNDHISSLMPGSEAYFNYVLFNNLSLTGQTVRCESIVRAYFFYKTMGYFDIALINSSYKGSQPTLEGYSDSELLKMSYDFPREFVMLGENITGKLVVKNVGLGFVDYYNQSIGSMNSIYNITLEIPADLKLLYIGGNEVNSSWVTINSEKIGGEDYKVYTLGYDKLKNYPGMLWMLTMGTGVGNTGLLYLPITLQPPENVKNYKIERIFVEIHYGYSYDLFKFNLNLYSSGTVLPNSGGEGGGASSSSGAAGGGGGGGSAVCGGTSCYR